MHPEASIQRAKKRVEASLFRGFFYLHPYLQEHKFTELLTHNDSNDRLPSVGWWMYLVERGRSSAELSTETATESFLRYNNTDDRSISLHGNFIWEDMHLEISGREDVQRKIMVARTVLNWSVSILLLDFSMSTIKLRKYETCIFH